jgi:gentisate 1,2-dioxygenase
VAAALDALPPEPDGSRRIRYVNPLNGRAALSLMDVTMLQIARDGSTLPFRTNSNALCYVVEGSGNSVIGDTRLDWMEKDVFSMPQNNWISHTAKSERARILVVSDRDALERLGVLKEEYAPQS